MSHPFSRRLFLSGALSALAGTALGNAPKRSARPKARPGTAVVASKSSVTGGAALVAAAKLGGRVGYAVADAKSGLVLEGHEAETAQPPASVAKAITALYALETLGAGHRFATRLIATGPVQGGVLQGDLILAGGGDPTLDTDALAAMAAELKAKGVVRVKGRFLVWGGALPSAGQIDADQPDHVSYNPAVSGIALNYNGVHFEWKRSGKGYGVSMQARTTEYRPDVSFARMKIIDRSLPVYTYASRSGQDHWTVAKAALGNGGSRWLPVRQPEVYAGEVFRTMAQARGITLPEAKIATQGPAGTVLVSHNSASLQVILRGMLRYSNNLTAEMVGLSATVARGGRVSSIRTSAAAMSSWAKTRLGMTSVRLVDHSGLGEASRLSAGDMARALVKVHGAGVLQPLMKSIALRDDRGRVVKTHPIKVQAKTGTLNFVSALAGYMTARDGTVMAFAVLAADEGARRKIKAGDRERPQGASGWNKRAKQLQQALIERWGAVYGS